MFDSLQNKLALFKDSNLNIIDSRFENRLSGLEAEFSLVSSVYQELAKQLEQSKLQVSKDTPIFSVIKPVTIPNKRSAPKRAQMVFIYLFIGIVLGSGFVLIKDPLKRIIQEICRWIGYSNIGFKTRKIGRFGSDLKRLK